MYKLFVQSTESHWCKILATISAPLSDLMKVGPPSKSMAYASVFTTPMALIRRAALLARHLWVNSSISIIDQLLPKKSLDAEQIGTRLQRVELLQSQSRSVAAICK